MREVIGKVFDESSIITFSEASGEQNWKKGTFNLLKILYWHITIETTGYATKIVSELDKTVSSFILLLI